MNREALKDLIDMISDNDVDTIFKILIRFVPEDEAYPEQTTRLTGGLDWQS